MKTYEEGRRLLQAAGYELVRHSRHPVYRHPVHRSTIVLPRTASDVRTIRNLKAQIARNERRARR